MKRKTKLTISIISTLILIIVVGATMIFIKKEDTLTFYIKNKPQTQYTITHEFGKELDLSPKAFKLTVKKGSKTYNITYKKPNITKLKTYKIKYHVKNEATTFTLNVKVVDTTAPNITGKLLYEVKQDEVFDVRHLQLKAFDLFDQDVTKNLTMKEVDTSKVGKYDIPITVSDSSHNVSSIQIHLQVKAKPIVPNPVITPKPSTMNQSLKPNTPNKIVVNNPNDVKVLINKTHILPDGWAPNDLIKINSNNGASHYLRKEAADQWEALRTDALNNGISIKVVSSYRSQAYQTKLFQDYMKTDPENAPFYSAYPRSSEHELGLAIDVSYDWSLHDNLHTSALGVWMNQNSWKYGWIVRYQQNKTHLTGYIYEPWHFRYVGVELATTLHNQGITMEEYFN